MHVQGYLLIRGLNVTLRQVYTRSDCGTDDRAECLLALRLHSEVADIGAQELIGPKTHVRLIGSRGEHESDRRDIDARRKRPQMQLAHIHDALGETQSDKLGGKCEDEKKKTGERRKKERGEGDL